MAQFFFLLLEKTLLILDNVPGYPCRYMYPIVLLIQTIADPRYGVLLPKIFFEITGIPTTLKT